MKWKMLQGTLSLLLHYFLLVNQQLSQVSGKVVLLQIFKDMCQSSLKDKIEEGNWIYFDWAGYSSGQKYILSSPETVEPFSYAEVIKIIEESIELRTINDQVLCIAPEGVIRSLPAPLVRLGNPVTVLIGSSAGQLGEVAAILWHHKDEEYKYTLSINGKTKSKRYTARDFRLPS